MTTKNTFLGATHLFIILFSQSLPLAAEGFPPVVELSDLDGTNGFVITSIPERAASSLTVSSAGDINGDGISDLIIGAPNADPHGRFSAGQSYVLFGKSQGFPATVSLADLDGSNGFAINGIAVNDRSGRSVAGVGDLNGDSIDDVVIGAWTASPNGLRKAGQSYVVFGSQRRFPAELELMSLKGRNGFIFNGIEENGFSGISVSSAGDFNGDGFDDLIIGASGVDRDDRFNVGQSYVIYGRPEIPAILDPTQLVGTNGFTLDGVGLANFDNFGFSVSSAGDINRDGFDDIIIGVPSAPIAGRDTAGQSYVIYGRRSKLNTRQGLSKLIRHKGFVLNGVANGDFSGKSVSTAGDVNGDGFSDLIIGAAGASPNGDWSAGQSYIVFGASEKFRNSVELSSLDGRNGFTLNGGTEGDSSGTTVSSAGDINGDGIHDLIICAPLASPGSERLFAGKTHVVFGTQDGFPAQLGLTALDGTNGFIIKGIAEGSRSCWSASGAGDINADGIGDLVIGAHFVDPADVDESGQSQSYVVFGR